MNDSERSKFLAFLASSLFTLVLLTLAFVTGTGLLHTVLSWGAAIWYILTVAGSPFIEDTPDMQTLAKFGAINFVIAMVILPVFGLAVSGFACLITAILAVVVYLGASAIATR